MRLCSHSLVCIFLSGDVFLDFEEQFFNLISPSG